MKVVIRYKSGALYDSEEKKIVNKRILAAWKESGVIFEIRAHGTKNLFEYPVDPEIDEDLSDFEQDPLTTRKCRDCNEFLPASRYFSHEICAAKREVQYGVEEYGGLAKVSGCRKVTPKFGVSLTQREELGRVA